MKKKSFSIKSSYFEKKMAKSKYEYVKSFERATEQELLPDCWLVVRIDGKGFHKFCDSHQFEKPNDERCINLMNKSATDTFQTFPDVILAYGQSDEYSFVIHKSSKIYKRRARCVFFSFRLRTNQLCF